ncbi:MAG: hypothetical protein ACYTGQ_02975 [Planctomycetota bacterium]
MSRATLLCAMTLLALVAPKVVAQSVNVTPEQFQMLLQRLEALESRHAEDQKKIEALERKVGELTDERRPVATPPVGVEPAPSATPSPAVAQAPAPSAPAVTPTSTLGQGNLLNAATTLFVDTGVSVSTDGDNERHNRFNLREIELDFAAPIAPFADGLLILAFGEEIEVDGDDVEIETHIEVEEALVDFHTLPWDLQFKAGKFRNAFGVNNQLHTHDLPQVTRPLAVEAFMGAEGLKTIGGSLSWLVPNPWDQYIEVTGELVNSDGGEESPILGGAGADNPAAVAHVKWFTDLDADSWLELGGSYLYGKTSDSSQFDASVFGLDVTYQWVDPEAPGSRGFLAQAEFFWAGNDIDEMGGAFRNNSFGFYAFGQYQLARDWYMGLRYDYTEFPNSEDRGPDDRDWALSPYLSWYMNELVRLRFEYQHHRFEEMGDWGEEDIFLLQLTFALGAHPAHPYWVNR